MSINLLIAAEAAASKNKFGLIEALNEGGAISWGIFTVMVIMSIGSFYILFTKLLEQNKVMKDAANMKANFWKAGGLKEGAAKLDKNGAYRQIVDDGLMAMENHGKLTDPTEAHDYLHGSLERSETSIMAALNGGLPFLATVGATAPFVGLLGTVIGIYSALIKIGIAGQASIDAVAGPVGEALIMTAIGLFVAVPAVIAYNWLQSRNKTIQADLNQFSNDVLGYMASGGSVKPATPVVATKPAAATAAKPAAPAAPLKK